MRASDQMSSISYFSAGRGDAAHLWAVGVAADVLEEAIQSPVLTFHFFKVDSVGGLAV